ncbi:MAG: hypothetical protein ACWA5L_08865 [bacterium]
MKTLLLAASALALSAFGLAVAQDFDLKTACEEYQAENGGTSDCGCLAEKVGDDEAMLEELAAVGAGEKTLEELSDETMEVIVACQPAE